jgi:chemotaxis protein MotB
MAKTSKKRYAGCDGRIGPAGDWNLIYTGFVLIMLTFFILLTSFASLESSKITRFVASFSNAVNVLDSGNSIEDGGTMVNDKVNILPRENLVTELFEKVRRVSREENLDLIDLKRTSAGVVMTLKETLLFDSGRAELLAQAYPRLEKIGRLIQTIQVPVEIEGHSDDRPIQSAQFSSNWELSALRAVTVLRYMIEKQEIDPRRLSAVGYSQYRPVAVNDSPSHRAMNRRVDFVFTID